jgi:hypothetical protein
MDTDSAKKSCKMCRMEIPQEARKCPFCHHFQNRISMVMYHPAFMALFACLPLGAMLFVFADIFDTGEHYETYKDQVVVTESQLAFGDMKSGATVAMIGTIKNVSPVSWKEIQFHVDFLDAAGKRVDVGEREDNSFQLPANETSSFKVSFRREFPETNYVKHSVRVVAAKDARARWLGIRTTGFRPGRVTPRCLPWPLGSACLSQNVGGASVLASRP